MAQNVTKPPHDDPCSCGNDAYTVAPVNDHLIRLADVIACTEGHHAVSVREFMHAEGKDIYILGIEDIYKPFTPCLVAILSARLKVLLPVASKAIAGRAPLRSSSILTVCWPVFPMTDCYTENHGGHGVRFTELDKGTASFRCGYYK